MKRGSTLLLKIAVVLIGLAVLAFCAIALPAGIMSDETGMYTPLFLAMYVPVVPFYFGLYQAWLLLSYIDQSKAFSGLSVIALKRIKYSAFAISALYALGMPLIFNVGDKDDAPGVVAIGLTIIFASVVVATFAAVLEKLVHNAIEIKSENDLTV